MYSYHILCAPQVWDAGTLELVSEKPNAHSDYIRSVDFSPDGSKIVSGSDDKALKVWDAGTLGLVSQKPNAHSHWITSVAFSPDGMSIVTAWNDGKLRAYLPESGRLIYDVPHAHHLDATAVVITDCNRLVRAESPAQNILIP